MNPLVSILVPVYGVARYVEQFAHSLLNQSYENLEIIIVNEMLLPIAVWISCIELLHGIRNAAGKSGILTMREI